MYFNVKEKISLSFIITLLRLGILLFSSNLLAGCSSRICHHRKNHLYSESDINRNRLEVNTTLIDIKGIKNTGNTCFANSVIQCLFASKAFNKHLEDEERNNGLLLYLLNHLRRNYLRSAEIYDPKVDLSSILVYLNIWSTMNQNSPEDPVDFLQKLLNQLSSESRNSKLCQIKIKQYQRNRNSHQWTIFRYKTSILEVNLPRQTLSRSLRNHYVIKRDIFNDYNADVTFEREYMKIIRAGKILIFHVDRNGQDSFHDDNIEMEEFITVGTKIYQLIGYVDYIKDINHYIAYIRRNNSWYHCNDSIITEYQMPGRICSRTNALIFYEILCEIHE